MTGLNELIRQSFRAMPALRIFSVLLMLLLIVTCAFGVFRAITAPTETTENVVQQSYSQRGNFEYTALLTDNLLYGKNTLTDKDTQLLFLSIVDDLDGSFSYRFDSDGPVQDVAHRARVEVVMAGSNWSKAFELIPDATWTGNFSLEFPIDTDMLLEQANIIGEQIGVRGATFDLTFNARVRTTATTGHGPINQTLVQTVGAKLDSSKLTWGGTTPYSQVQYGTLSEKVTVPLEAGSLLTVWSVGLALAVLAGGWVAWNALHSQTRPATSTEAEAIRAAKKHGDILVDVQGLPQINADETPASPGAPGLTVVPVSSLDELIKAAETLGKPVLHRAGPDEHVYSVIDGLTSYEYVAREPPYEE